MPTKIDDSLFDVKEKSLQNKALLAQSFNSETTLNEETKLIIVGTLTPPTAKYFYCSYLNRIYGYIDEALKELGRSGKEPLKGLKVGLSEYKNISLLTDKEEIKERVDKIKEILSRNKIAFLDVMDRAIRLKEGSCYDDDIDCYTLAEKDFKRINASGATIIANSRLAEKCVKEMKLGCRYRSQRVGKKDDWIKDIIDAIKE